MDYPFSFIVSSHPAPSRMFQWHRTHIFLRQIGCYWTTLMAENFSFYTTEAYPILLPIIFILAPIISQIFPPHDTFSYLKTLLIPWIDFSYMKNFPISCCRFCIINSEQGTIGLWWNLKPCRIKKDYIWALYFFTCRLTG